MDTEGAYPPIMCNRWPRVSRIPTSLPTPTHIKDLQKMGELGVAEWNMTVPVGEGGDHVP